MRRAWLALVAAAALAWAPAPTSAAPGDLVPEAKSETLAKTKFAVPADFPAERNVLLFSFGREMQAAIDAWDAALAGLRDGKAVQVYNMPLIPNPGGLVRGFISSGMRGAYEDKAVRERVVILFVDEKTYFPALGVTDRSAPLVVVADKAGREIGRVQAVLSDQALGQVRALVAGSGS